MKKTMLILVSLMTASFAFAQDGMGAAYAPNTFAALGAGLCIALAAIGGAFAQGRAASVALEGIARNPAASDKLFTPMIIALALIESLVIYAFVIAFMIKP
ncbi:MAG: ATP synthase F0 subunit C [Halobacteriovoraceae bacterium]|nr:ATP synthase F0 subunit C [Halobacteriovoraceae bacterium]